MTVIYLKLIFNMHSEYLKMDFHPINFWSLFFLHYILKLSCDTKVLKIVLL